MRKLSLVLFLVLLDLVMIQTIFGYDNEMAHPKITELAVQKSVLKTYLPQNLGPDFSKGYDSLIGIKSVIRWISEGSIAEDAQPCRRANHMHNPLLPWIQSQMSDTPWMNYACDVPRYSNITWATEYTYPPLNPKAPEEETK